MLHKEVIIDTDIGSDVDDAFALVFALKSKEIKIRAVLTNNSLVREKAKIVNAFDKNLKVFHGIEVDKGLITTTIRGEDKSLPLKENLDFFKNKKLTYISLGALSNLAFLIDKGIEFEEVYIMGGSLKYDYEGNKRKVKEWNLNCDLSSSLKVFSSNLKITLVPLDSTWNLKLKEEHITMLKNDPKRNSVLLYKHLEEMRKFLEERFGLKNKIPVLHDPFTVYVSFGKNFFVRKKLKLSLLQNGFLQESAFGKEMDVIIKSDNAFLNFFIRRLLE